MKIIDYNSLNSVRTPTFCRELVNIKIFFIKIEIKFYCFYQHTLLYMPKLRRMDLNHYLIPL